MHHANDLNWPDTWFWYAGGFENNFLGLSPYVAAPWPYNNEVDLLFFSKYILVILVDERLVNDPFSRQEERLKVW